MRTARLGLLSLMLVSCVRKIPLTEQSSMMWGYLEARCEHEGGHWSERVGMADFACGGDQHPTPVEVNAAYVAHGRKSYECTAGRAVTLRWTAGAFAFECQRDALLVLEGDGGVSPEAMGGPNGL